MRKLLAVVLCTITAFIFTSCVKTSYDCLYKYFSREIVVKFELIDEQVSIGKDARELYVFCYDESVESSILEDIRKSKSSDYLQLFEKEGNPPLSAILRSLDIKENKSWRDLPMSTQEYGTYYLGGCGWSIGSNDFIASIDYSDNNQSGYWSYVGTYTDKTNDINNGAHELVIVDINKNFVIYASVSK